MKAVIIAAGYGTRFLPATKTIPKEMFPLIDRPAIDFIVQECIDSGIEEILIISSRRKKVLEDYFDREIELENVFQAGNSPELEKINPPAARFTFIRQQRMRGTGDALLACENFAAGEPLVVAYPDDLVFGPLPLSRQLIECRSSDRDCVLAVMRVPGEDTHRYGIVESGPDGQVRRIVEKPAPGTATCNLALIGRYIITPEIFPLLREEQKKNPEGEYYQIDPMNRLAERGVVRAVEFKGQRLDTGAPEGYLRAVLEYALMREDLRPTLKQAVEALSRRL